MSQNWAQSNIFALLIFMGISIGFITIVFMRYWAQNMVIPDSKHAYEMERSTNERNFWKLDTNSLLHDLRLLCLSYVGIVMCSEILSDGEKYNLYSILLPHFSIDSELIRRIKVLNLRLLYRAADVSFNQKAFYLACDGYNNVLIVLKNDCGNVVGGFMSIGIQEYHQQFSKYSVWRLLPGTQYLADSNAFLFRVRSNCNLSPKIFKSKPNKYSKKAVMRCSPVVFAFGKGELYVEINSENKPNYKKGLNIGRCVAMSHGLYGAYEFDAIEFIGRQIPNYTALTNCNIKMIEVFQIKV